MWDSSQGNNTWSFSCKTYKPSIYPHDVFSVIEIGTISYFKEYIFINTLNVAKKFYFHDLTLCAPPF